MKLKVYVIIYLKSERLKKKNITTENGKKDIIYFFKNVVL